MRVFELKELGLVKITKRKASRNIRLSINTHGEISVSSPHRVSYNQTLTFVWRNRDWIQNQRQKQQQIKQQNSVFYPDKVYPTILGGLNFKLVNKSNEIRMAQKPTLTTLLLPEKYEHNNPKIQDFIRREYLKLIRTDAETYLPERLRQLAEQYGFIFNHVTIRNQRTRWGSCSTKGNINLNMHLVRLPQELLDMVLIHELCHTLHPNHGKLFYKLLYAIIPDYKNRNSRIKKYKFNHFYACDELP
ncbi:MAG: DUF45 domain-containing protein [Bacteroidetes bacterium]|jgi:predicted metal-dependent hydrolase|nr:DUF45 domain-containing protein [Bacteroidota bacterium]